jgi:hypothetical protein
MILRRFDGLCSAEQGVLEAASEVGVECATAAVAASVERHPKACGGTVCGADVA